MIGWIKLHSWYIWILFIIVCIIFFLFYFLLEINILLDESEYGTQSRLPFFFFPTFFFSINWCLFFYICIEGDVWVGRDYVFIVSLCPYMVYFLIACVLDIGIALMITWCFYFIFFLFLQLLLHLWLKNVLVLMLWRLFIFYFSPLQNIGDPNSAFPPSS